MCSMKPCRKRPQLRASTWQASVARLCCKRAAVHKSIAKLLPAALLLSMSSILQPVSPESSDILLLEQHLTQSLVVEM